MNKPMAVWGLLLFAGFLLTHYFVFSSDSIWVAPLWVVLAVIGAVFQKASCKCRGKKCSCCCSDIWAFSAVEGLIITVAIAIQLLPISAFYLLSVWLLVLGSAMAADSLRDRKALKMQLGLLWMFCAVFFPFVSNYQYSSFIMGALVLGVALMLAGIMSKD